MEADAAELAAAAAAAARLGAMSYDERAAFCKEHPVASTYPVIFRHVLTTGKFSRPAFERYYAKFHKQFWPKRLDMSLAQIEYYIAVYRAEHPRAPPRELQHYRAELERVAKEEEETIKDAGKQADDEHAKACATFRQQLAARVREEARALKARQEGDG